MERNIEVDAADTVCVVDANIFIDFNEASILSKIAEANFSIITTDIIAGELEKPSFTELKRIGVKIVSLDVARMQRLAELSLIYRQPSLADLSALVVAEYMNVMLLTGDVNLRRASQNENISVHGTIWLLKRVEQQGAISGKEVERVLNIMRQKGRRLPKSL